MTFEGAARQASRLAAALLGWRPDDFWSATPEDLRNALGLAVVAAAEPATGTMLKQLMEAFPDER